MFFTYQEFKDIFFYKLSYYECYKRASNKITKFRKGK